MWVHHLNSFAVRAPGTEIKSIAADFDVFAPVKIVMMLMSEADLLPTWMPAFLGLEVRRLAQPSRFRQLIYLKIWLPWPFRDREMVFDAMGVDVIKEHGGILVVVRSYDVVRDADLYGDVDVPEVASDRVRIDIKMGGVLVKPHQASGQLLGYVCVCVCVCVCMYACMHVCTHTHTHTCMLAYMHTYKNTCMHAYIHTYMNV